MSKTNDEVYDEIRDREEFISAKLLKKKQMSVYFDRSLYEKLLRLAKEDGRSFNSMLTRLVQKGLATLQDV